MELNLPAALEDKLCRLEGRGYKAYKDLQGSVWSFGPVQLTFEHVQGDSFAAPSRMVSVIPYSSGGFPEDACRNPLSCLALEDFLLRRFHSALLRRTTKPAGSGKSGVITALKPSQKILKRSAVTVTEDQIEFIFFVGLPAEGRRILGKECARLFKEDIPEVLLHTLTVYSLDTEELKTHSKALEDYEALRAQLIVNGWAGFVADESRLARTAGDADIPMENCVPFKAPDNLCATLSLPNAGDVRGMPLMQGVTLLVGGGFHGKSTLLKALQNAVYPHIPGDGRECVAVDPTAVKIRAEDGRFASQVDISPFLDNLPGVESTRHFSTTNASGSTSQAVNIIEALETGCKLLLLDEDTCATNFMIRDARMQALIHKDREPITPFVDRVRELYEQPGVSTVIVMGGCGDYFDVADTVVTMENFQPRLVSDEARQIARDMPTGRKRETPSPFPELNPGRIPPEKLKFRKGKKEIFLAAYGCDGLTLGVNRIDTHDIEQLIETGQLEACGWILLGLKEWLETNDGSSVEGVKVMLGKIEEQGVSSLMSWNNGLVAAPRLQEVMAVLNRMRF